MYNTDDGNLSEKYLSGANAGDLTIHPRREGAVEAIVEVSWSRGRVGAALLRLHSQWDGAAKRGVKLEQVFLQLKDLPAVRTALIQWAEAERVPQPEDVTAAVLCWWLASVCHVCNGSKWEVRPNRPKRPCRACHGSSEAPIPYGNTGRAMLAFMDDCRYRHRASIRGRVGR